MGKGKMFEPEKPKKPTFVSLQTSRAFKIYERKALVPPESLVTQPMKKSLALKNKPVETPSRVAIILKLVDKEEDLKAQQPSKVAPGPIPIALILREESEVKEIEAPLVRKRKLVKGVNVAGLEAEAKNVANILSARRKQAPKPSVPIIANVEAFLANELIEVSPMNAAGPVLEEPLQVIGGPILELVLDHP